MKKPFLQRITVVMMFLLIFFVIAMPAVSFAKIKSGIIPCGNTPPGATLEQINAEACDFNDFLQLGKNIINYLVLLSIPLAAIAFAWAGFLYITSGGSEGKIGKAKDIFWKVMWGFIFILTAWLIVYSITKFLDPGFSYLG